MWQRFDTLLIRLLAVMSIAISAAFVFSFLLAQMQHSTRGGIPRSSLTVAIGAMEELRMAGWPAAMSRAELARMHLAEYSRTTEPLGQSSAGMFSDLVRERLGLGADTAVAFTMDADGPLPFPERPTQSNDGWPFGDGGRDGNAEKGPVPKARGGPGIGPRQFPKAVASIVSVQIGPDDWVNVRTKRVSLGPEHRPWVVLFALVLLVAIAIWAARNAISPLKQMARAADVLGSDYRHHALAETGPSDVRQALAAFNRMGCRLESTVSNQRQVLAAIGHDLRTPITSLKLKIEMLSDPGERERMTRAIGELERLTEAALIAASAGESSEPFERLDLYSVIDSVADELSDLGSDVIFLETDHRPIVRGRSDQLMRVVRNIAENAVRYGERARISLDVHAGVAGILVSDDGPGIPEASMDAVFQPLVRLEQSRSRDTGGHGLGLHIAKTIVEAHHGTIRIRNRPEGGLEAEIKLPLDHG